VPNQALRYIPSGLAGVNETGQARIWIPRDPKPVSVPVTVGLEDDSFTEIVSGDLKPSDQVITAEQTTTDSKTVMPSLRF
jgi:HlyD family secretion protein